MRRSSSVRPWITTTIGCVLCVLLGAMAMHRLRVRRDSGLARARNLRGQRGEDHAEALLVASGYEIVARQQRTSYGVWTAAGEVRIGLALDFVVRRDGREWVAEVKTGASTAPLRHAETRRQLLEYQLASGASSVLLVEPEYERITEVCFPLPGITPPAPDEISADPNALQYDVATSAPPAPPGSAKSAFIVLAVLTLLLWLALRGSACAACTFAACQLSGL